MRVMIFSGSHPRHSFVHKAILESDLECAAVIMEREDLVPEPPLSIPQNDRDNFIRHFQERDNVESRIFGQSSSQEVFCNIPTLYCQAEDLNTNATVEFVKNFKPDWAFIFGVDLIKDPLLSLLPKDKINLHLGLSPWYRGSATLFWPFYFLQPQYAGVTFHQIVPEADAGDIIHQSVPEIKFGDGIHDVSARAVVRAKYDLIKLVSIYKERAKWDLYKQKSSGCLFLSKFFQPEHLRVIYELYDDDIVDYYLNNKTTEDNPLLFKQPGM